MIEKSGTAMRTATDYALIAAAVGVFAADIFAPAGYGLPFVYAALLWFMPGARKLKAHAYRIGMAFAVATIAAGVIKGIDGADVILFNRFMALAYIGGAAHTVRDQIDAHARIEQLERRLG